MMSHEQPKAARPAAAVPRAPIDAIRHVAQLLLMVEPTTAASIAVRSRWAEDLHRAANALEDTPSTAEAAEAARLALEAARAAVEQGVAALAGTLAQVGVATLVEARDQFAWHSGLIDLPDGRKLNFEGTLEVME
jgi:myo-inositol catabolism protein IolC